MKNLLLIAFVFAGSFAFSQSTEDEDLQKIWETNVQPLIDLNVDQLKEYTQIPPGGDWYEEIDPEMWEDDVTEEFFWENLETIFTPEVRELLSAMDYNKLSVMGDENWTIVTLLVVLTKNEEGWAETSIGLDFEWVEDRWLLTGISFIG